MERKPALLQPSRASKTSRSAADLRSFLRSPSEPARVSDLESTAGCFSVPSSPPKPAPVPPSTMAALRASCRRLPTQAPALRRAIVPSASAAHLFLLLLRMVFTDPCLCTHSARFASTDAVDPKSKASSLIDALPGNSVVSKTGWVTLGTALTGAAISNEVFVLNDEAVIFAGFVTFVTLLGSYIRQPYTEWADNHIAVRHRPRLLLAIADPRD